MPNARIRISDRAFFIPPHPRSAEVDMDAKAQLERQIASANDHLRAAQRNGCCADIMTWRERRDALLDQYPTPDSPREN